MTDYFFKSAVVTSSPGFEGFSRRCGILTDKWLKTVESLELRRFESYCAVEVEVELGAWSMWARTCVLRTTPKFHWNYETTKLPIVSCMLWKTVFIICNSKHCISITAQFRGILQLDYKPVDYFLSNDSVKFWNKAELDFFFSVTIGVFFSVFLA